MLNHLLACLSRIANTSPAQVKSSAVQQMVTAQIFSQITELIWVTVLSPVLVPVQRVSRNVQCVWEGWGEGQKSQRKKDTALSSL